MWIGHDSLRGAQGVLSVWSLKKGRRIKVMPVDSELTQVNSVVFNHNGNMLVTGGADGCVRLYDMVTCSPIMKWQAHAGHVTNVWIPQYIHIIHIYMYICTQLNYTCASTRMIMLVFCFVFFCVYMYL